MAQYFKCEKVFFTVQKPKYISDKEIFNIPEYLKYWNFSLAPPKGYIFPMNLFDELSI